MSVNYKYISECLSERSLKLEADFASQLKYYADLYGKKII